MSAEQPAITFREALSNAIRYWERRRLLFNSALLIVVAGAFVAGWPISKTWRFSIRHFAICGSAAVRYCLL